MSWYLIIPLQILGIYLCNRIVFKYLDTPLKKEQDAFNKFWEFGESPRYGANMSYEDEKKYKKEYDNLDNKKTFILTLDWFYILTIVVFPISFALLRLDDDYEHLVGMLLVPWFGSFIIFIFFLNDHSKFFKLLFRIFWYLCLLSLLWFWLYAIGLELTIFEDYLGKDLGLMYVILTLIISLFGFPGWLFDKIKQIKFLDKLKIVEKNTISYIIIAIIYLPIVVKMLDS